MGIDPYGNDMYGAHTAHFKADVLITLIDVWVIKPSVVEDIAPALWLPWLPIDHQPPPEIVLKRSSRPICRSATPSLAATKLEKAGVPNVYIPHGVETDTFKVLPDATVKEFRQTVCEDAAWLGVMISANKGWPSRKGFEETLQAFKRALPYLPQPAMLYIHADYTKALGGGDLAGLVKSMGLADHVRFPEPLQAVDRRV